MNGALPTRTRPPPRSAAHHVTSGVRSRLRGFSPNYSDVSRPETTRLSQAGERLLALIMQLKPLRGVFLSRSCVLSFLLSKRKRTDVRRKSQRTRVYMRARVYQRKTALKTIKTGAPYFVVWRHLLVHKAHVLTNPWVLLLYCYNHKHLGNTSEFIHDINQY